MSTAKKSSKNLTEGNILKLIVTFAMPVFLGQLFQNLYNSVDSIVVGQFCGTEALAAVSACTDLSRLTVGFFNGWAIGSGVLFSRFYGAGDNKKLETAIHTSVLFAGLMGISVSILGILGTDFLLKLTAVPADIFDQTALYLRIYMIGLMFISIYNVGAGVLRSVGDSKSPFYYLIISSVTNMVLDVVFTGGLKMGVMGVAVATVIAQGLSVFLVFRNMMTTDDIYRLDIKKLAIDKKMLNDTLTYALPTAMQMSIIALSNTFIQRYRNGFGSVAIAGMGAARKINDFVSSGTQAIGAAVTTFISQNHGANKDERAFRGVRESFCLTMGVIILFSAVLFVFAPFFVKLFVTEEEAVGYGVAMIRYTMPFCFVQAFDVSWSNGLRGFGYARENMVGMIFGIVVVRQIFLAISMNIKKSLLFIYLSFPLGWFGSALIAGVFYWLLIASPYKKTGAISPRRY